MDADPLAEGVGDAFEHGETVAVIVGVFQAADDGLGRPDLAGEVLLVEIGREAKLVDLLGNPQVLPLAGQRRQSFLTAFDISPVKNRHGVGCLFVGGHQSASRYVCFSGALLYGNKYNATSGEREQS